MAPTIAALWVYPIKACQGVQVQSATLGTHGFALDRIFCVVDLEGTRHPKCEALSQRKLPGLGAVATALSEDGATVTLSTPDGRKPLVLATDAAAYADEELVEVECGGKDTITGAGWFLGKVRCRSAGEEACKWLSAYLNAAERADPFADEPCAKPPARYCLVRSDVGAERDMATFVGPAAPRDSSSVELRGFDMPEIPVLQTGDPRGQDAVRFQDFAPFLVTTEASLKALNDAIEASSAATKAGFSSAYPMKPFRPSIVLSGVEEAWAEETWLQFTSKERVVFRRLKVCPRCTVPCRDQETGGFVVSKYPLLPTAVLTKAYPEKRKAFPEWGSWQGPIFGTYYSHGGREGELHVGSELDVTQNTSMVAGGDLACKLGSVAGVFIALGLAAVLVQRH